MEILGQGVHEEHSEGALKEEKFEEAPRREAALWRKVHWAVEKRTEAHSRADSQNHWTWEAELRKRDGLWLGSAVFLRR